MLLNDSWWQSKHCADCVGRNTARQTITGKKGNERVRKRVREWWGDRQQWTLEENHTDDSCMAVHITHSWVLLWEVWDSNLHQVSNVSQHAHRWQPYRCLNSAPCWSALVESPSSTNKKQTLFQHVSIIKIFRCVFIIYVVNSDEENMDHFATMEIVKWANMNS